jgi:hypothetical protein
MSNFVQMPLETPAVELFQRVGIFQDLARVPNHLKLFVEQAEDVLSKVRSMISVGSLPEHRGIEFQQLLVDVCARVLCHPIVENNRYLARFSQGVTEAQARHECQQFSVFALQFDVAQAKLVSNAPTEEAYTERLQVLLNEKGIPFKDGFDGELTGQWNSGTVHFTWMRNMAGGLGLGFKELGKVWIGLPGTRAFVSATFDYYANTDQSIASGASFAIENWAANSLWKPWIEGMEIFNRGHEKQVDLGYLRYHDMEEQHHSQATLDELLENFVEPWFDADRFLNGAEDMLNDGVLPYYKSQLATLPDKDESWPSEATSPRSFELDDLARIAGAENVQHYSTD